MQTHLLSCVWQYSKNWLLMSYTRFVHTFLEGLLSCEDIKVRCTADKLYSAWLRRRSEKKLDWNKCHCICTDGAAAMGGNNWIANSYKKSLLHLDKSFCIKQTNFIIQNQWVSFFKELYHDLCYIVKMYIDCFIFFKIQLFQIDSWNRVNFFSF